MEGEIIELSIFENMYPTNIKVGSNLGEVDFLSTLLDVIKEIKDKKRNENLSLVSLNISSFLIGFPTNTPNISQEPTLEHDKPIDRLYQDTRISKDYSFTNLIEDKIETKPIGESLNKVGEKASYEDFPYEDSINKVFKNSESFASSPFLNITIEGEKDQEYINTFSKANLHKITLKEHEVNPLIETEDEEKVENLLYKDPLQKENNIKLYYEEIKTEEIKRQPLPKGYEPKHLSVNFEEANLRLNFLGDRLRLYMNLNEDIYRQPTSFEIQKLAQSLQNMGLNLEILKLNGNLLYGSDHRYGNKRDEKGKYLPNPIDTETDPISKKDKSFDIYL